MESVIGIEPRPAVSLQVPSFIRHWDGKEARLDASLILISLLKPMERRAFAGRLEGTGLQPVETPPRLPDAETGLREPEGCKVEPLPVKGDRWSQGNDTRPLPTIPYLNESMTAYFVQSSAGKPITSSQLNSLVERLGRSFEWAGPIYQFAKAGDAQPFADHFCPFPRTLLVELRPGADPRRLDEVLRPENLRVDWKFIHPKLFCLRFGGAPWENVFSLRDRLASQYQDTIRSVHFENMPMLNPQQGGFWNHVRIQSNVLAQGDPSLSYIQVPIAVIDRGVQFQNDYSGLIPNSGGWNAKTFAFDTGVVESDPHGTCCAGIISEPSRQFAVTSNPASYPILSVIAPNFTDAQIAAAIGYAANFCPVISMSLNDEHGVWNPAVIGPSLNHAVYMQRTICMSSGNGNRNRIPYPANVPAVLAVGATDVYDARAVSAGWGSNYGPELDVCAPGVSVYTTDLNGTAGTNPMSGIIGAVALGFSGTSAAAPHVAAVAAMIICKCNYHGILCTPERVRSRIRGTADKVPNPGIYVGGFHQEYGYGRLNAQRALDFSDEYEFSSVF